MTVHVVTGAFGYTGKYITSRLLDQGIQVRTLTNSLHRPHPFGDTVQAFPYAFDQPDELVRYLTGAEVLYNTYWVRFDHKDFTHAQAIQNTLTLFKAAARAGVRRIVHVSITNPDKGSDLPYFRGKALLEEALMKLGFSYAILRPAVIFGREDILINNIAWVLRRFPVFGVFGDGNYRLRPIYVEDFADLAVAAGKRMAKEVVDAVGPETYTFRALVETIGRLIGASRPIVSVPPSLGYWIAWAIGKWRNDVFLTREEIEGLMRDLLYTDAPSAGTTHLSTWVAAHADELGVRYASELARRRQRHRAYTDL